MFLNLYIFITLTLPFFTIYFNDCKQWCPHNGGGIILDININIRMKLK